MPTQLVLRFEDVPVTCPVRARYDHACLTRSGCAIYKNRVQPHKEGENYNAKPNSSAYILGRNR
jgi:hypothetical protein